MTVFKLKVQGKVSCVKTMLHCENEGRKLIFAINPFKVEMLHVNFLSANYSGKRSEEVSVLISDSRDILLQLLHTTNVSPWWAKPNIIIDSDILYMLSTIYFVNSVALYEAQLI